MQVNRRQLIVIAAAACVGCEHREERDQGHAATSKPATTQTTGAIDAGPITSFPPDTVSDAFRDRGFFVIHRGKQIFALSATCTHKGCKVRAASDESFFCKCHGSTFDREGRVTKGPATRDLPRVAVATDERMHVLVDPTRLLAAHVLSSPNPSRQVMG